MREGGVKVTSGFRPGQMEALILGRAERGRETSCEEPEVCRWGQYVFSPVDC